MPTPLKDAAAEWERRSLLAASFAEMVDLQRKADQLAHLAQQDRAEELAARPGHNAQGGGDHSVTGYCG